VSVRENTTCFLLINVHLLNDNSIVSDSYLLSRLGLLREFLDIVEGAVIEVCSYIKVAEYFVLCCSVLTKCNIIKVKSATTVPFLQRKCVEISLSLINKFILEQKRMRILYIV
jgi:hypothetical protein